jgi:hypothetical protein
MCIVRKSFFDLHLPQSVKECRRCRIPPKLLYFTFSMETYFTLILDFWGDSLHSLPSLHFLFLKNNNNMNIIYKNNSNLNKMF